MILGVIPARYGSTRFPGKPLARLAGKPLVQWVWERASEVKVIDRLVVATDHQEIFEAAEKFGAEVVMTDPELASGTDRIWQVAQNIEAEIVVNIQGDEPLVSTSMVAQMVEALASDPEAQMSTLCYPMKIDAHQYEDPNVVKVVLDHEGCALYFSRASIPYYRQKDQAGQKWYKHMGFYAYRRTLLEQFVQWPCSALEQAEQLEQLRALEAGVRIKVVSSDQDTIGVDTPEDLKRVEQILQDA